MVESNLSLWRAAAVATLALLLVLTTVKALDSPEANWHTVDGGGGTLVGAGDLSLSGTIGQPDSGLLTGGAYSLGGGFWGGGRLSPEYKVYLPLILRECANQDLAAGGTR